MTAAKALAAEIRAGDFEDRGWMIDALDKAAQLLDASTDLDGATDVPTLGAAITTAGEFAARWNALPAEAREMRAAALSATARTAEKCFMEGHASAAERIASWCETTARGCRHEAIDVMRRNRGNKLLASGYHGRAAALDDLAARLRDGRLS